jgi:nucleotide-binding universal stress UspA family protein
VSPGSSGDYSQYVDVDVGMQANEALRIALKRAFATVELTSGGASGSYDLLVTPRIVAMKAYRESDYSVTASVTYELNTVRPDGSAAGVVNGGGTGNMRRGLGWKIISIPVELPLILIAPLHGVHSRLFEEPLYERAFLDANQQAAADLVQHLLGSSVIDEAIVMREAREDPQLFERRMGELAASVVSTIREGVLAVAVFAVPRGASGGLGVGLAQELRAHLREYRQIVLAEERLTEGALSAVGIEAEQLAGNPEVARKFARLTSADALVVGHAQIVGPRVDLTIEVIELDQATVTSRETAVLIRDSKLRLLESRQ